MSLGEDGKLAVCSSFLNTEITSDFLRDLYVPPFSVQIVSVLLLKQVKYDIILKHKRQIIILK